MEALRSEYADLRGRYQMLLSQTAHERDPSLMDQKVSQLVDLNQKMSEVVHQMQALATQFSSKADLTQLQGRLSEELTHIQRDAQSLEDSRSRREVLSRMMAQISSKGESERRTLWGYLVALCVALVLTILALLSATWAGIQPAMPPAAPPDFTMGVA